METKENNNLKLCEQGYVYVILDNSEIIRTYLEIIADLKELSSCNCDDSEMYSELLDDLQRDNPAIDIESKIKQYASIYNTKDLILKRYQLYENIAKLEESLQSIGTVHE